MTKELKAEIHKFICYFKKHLDEINAIETSHTNFYQQFLYVSIVDTLARSVLPKQRNNKERFICFVQQFCKWKDGERVSLAHLVQLLRKNPDLAFEPLQKWAREEYKKLPGGPMLISHDPLLDEVRSKLPTKKESHEKLDGIELSRLSHFNLLYMYRNTLVHEFRPPGYGMNIAGDTSEPYYHRMSTADGSNHTIELVYPRKFLYNLCKTSLKELEQYLLKNELNPYDSFVFGTYWIKSLNS